MSNLDIDFETGLERKTFNISYDGRHDYTPEEDEVLQALEKWKKERRKRFPSTIDTFRVIESMGYQKAPQEP